MAKGILSQRLYELQRIGVAVEAAAVANPVTPAVSPSAIKALNEIGCDKWLVGHRPRKLCEYLQARADLIVTLTGDHGIGRKPDRESKVVSDEELFGQRITEPWPDDGDEASLARYRQTHDELVTAIDQSLDAILKRVGEIPTI